jgi:hypothetical protein
LASVKIVDATLWMSTQTIAKPRDDGPLADPDADAQALAGSGVTLRSLHRRERTVAGLTGRDALAEVRAAAAPPRLMYRFFYGGTPGNASAPEVIIALDGPASERAELDRVWSGVLDSMRPVPLR